MRYLGLDIHRDFCEVAIAEDGRVRSAGRIGADPASLAAFATTLHPDDVVTLEAIGNALAMARILEPHARVVLANPKAVHGITAGRAKTDRIDARALASLLAGGFLPVVWTADEPTAALRRQVTRRAGLITERTRAKNQIHAALVRNLTPRQPMSDLFGRRGGLARRPLGRSAACLLAAHRRQARRQHRHGGGGAQAGRHRLHLLSDDTDYAFARPSLVREKLRRLELLTGAQRNRGKRTGIFATRDQHRLEQELAAQAEIAYRRLVADWTPSRTAVRASQTGRASHDAERQPARQG